MFEAQEYVSTREAERTDWGGMGDEVAELDGILIPENVISLCDNLEFNECNSKTQKNFLQGRDRM